MSGIAGIIHFDGKPVEPGLIEKMTSAMAYRGPDGIHHWVKGSVALGQCMLRTTPESLEETQPLTNEDESLVLVMDGRVDNWEELRKDLLSRGVRLRTRADAELVLRAYEIWGRDCLAQIDGDFALVIWDARRQEALCARDRMGNKPFNYHWDSETFAFASELHAILALPWVREELNEGMLAEFLADEWYSRSETLWQGVLRLVSAHRMAVNLAGVHAEKYWSPDLGMALPYSNDEDYVEHYRELLVDTVRRLSRSHRPVAYEVSGGLDSSAVFCLAHYLRQVDRLPAPGIEGYTLAFEDDGEANELAYARAVGEYSGIRIHEIRPSIFTLSWYETQARASRDFPGYPNGLMHQGLYQEACSRGGVVLLTGLGGDQWLQGSRAYYAEELTARRWTVLFECFMADARVFGAPQAAAWLLRHGCAPLLPAMVKSSLRAVMHRIRGNVRRGAYWLSPEMRERLERRRVEQQSGYEGVHRQGQRSLLQTMFFAFDALGRELCECLSASSVIEIRHPLLAPQLVQYAFSLPERLRLRGNKHKYIHRKALQSLMPQVVIGRSTKADFAGVFSGYLDQMEQEFFGELARARTNWLDGDGVSKLFKSYQQNPEQGWQCWALWNIYGCDLVLPQA